MFFFPDHLQVAWRRATRSLPIPTRSWTCSQRSFDWSLCTQHCLPRSATRSATASCFSQSTRPSPGTGDQAAPRSQAGTAGATDASGAEGSSKAGGSGSQGGARNGELVFEAAKVEERTTRSSIGRESQETKLRFCSRCCLSWLKQPGCFWHYLFAAFLASLNPCNMVPWFSFWVTESLVFARPDPGLSVIVLNQLYIEYVYGLYMVLTYFHIDLCLYFRGLRSIVVYHLPLLSAAIAHGLANRLSE